MFIFWWNTWIYSNENNGITLSVSLSVLKFEFSCAQYRYHQRMSSLWEKGLQGELGDLRQGKPAQDESKIVGFAHKIFKDCCVKRGRVISDGRNSLTEGDEPWSRSWCHVTLSHDLSWSGPSVMYLLFQIYSYRYTHNIQWPCPAPHHHYTSYHESKSTNDDIVTKSLVKMM